MMICFGWIATLADGNPNRKEQLRNQTVARAQQALDATLQH